MKQIIEKGSTLFLRAAVVGVAAVVLGLCALVLPVIYRDWAAEFPEIANATYLIIAGLSLTAIALVAALYQAWRILDYVDNDTAFSSQTVHRLCMIKKYLLIIAGLYAAGWPIIFHLAQLDDAPGLILIYGAIFVGIPVVLAVGLAVLQRLLQSAINIKSENDLTV